MKLAIDDRLLNIKLGLKFNTKNKVIFIKDKDFKNNIINKNEKYKYFIQHYKDKDLKYNVYFKQDVNRKEKVIVVIYKDDSILLDNFDDIISRIQYYFNGSKSINLYMLNKDIYQNLKLLVKFNELNSMINKDVSLITY